MGALEELPCHRDWDYVSMADYQSDMREALDMSSHAIGILRREIDGLKRTLAAVVLSAGGSVTVPQHLLGHRGAEIELIVEEHEYDLTRRFRALATSADKKGVGL